MPLSQYITTDVHKTEADKTVAEWKKAVRLTIGLNNLKERELLWKRKHQRADLLASRQ
jgi:hypothetical protein